MKKLKALHVYLIIQIISGNLALTIFSMPSAVTYQLNNGRFGDHLLNYLHAEWFSYVYKVPLLYHPFDYSNKLVLHDAQFTLDDYGDLYGNNVEYVCSDNQLAHIDSKAGKLYVIPYFDELSVFYPSWDCYFKVDWKDPVFLDKIRRLVRPKRELKLIYPPKNMPSVALHVRTGGGVDVDYKVVSKFMIDDFYLNGIRALADELDKQPLYIYLFTDHEQPEVVALKFKAALSEYSQITWDWRKEKNGPYRHVLEDLFSMMNFDYLIRGESHLGIIAGILGSFKKIIVPTALADAIAYSPHAQHSFYPYHERKIMGHGT